MTYLDCQEWPIDENEVIINKDIEFINDKGNKEFEFWKREKGE